MESLCRELIKAPMEGLLPAWCIVSAICPAPMGGFILSRVCLQGPCSPVQVSTNTHVVPFLGISGNRCVLTGGCGMQKQGRVGEFRDVMKALCWMSNPGLENQQTNREGDIFCPLWKGTGVLCPALKSSAIRTDSEEATKMIRRLNISAVKKC